MGKNVFKLFLALAVAAIAGLSGCQGSPNAQEIAANSLAAYEKVSTVSFEANGVITIEITGAQSMNATMLMDFAGKMDIPNKAMQMTGEASADIPGMGKQSMPMDVYLTEGAAYSKVGVPGHGGQWFKLKLDDKLWQDQDQLAQQMEFLKTAGNVTLAGEETIDGKSSYVLVIDPDMKVLTEWVLSQQTGSGLDLGKLDLAKMFKSFSVKEWIAKDSYLPVKAEVIAVIEIKAEDVGAPAGELDKMIMKMKMTEKFLDYNKPVAIVLPEDAKDAQEVPTGR